MNGDVPMSVESVEPLKERERFFVPALTEAQIVFCGDERVGGDLYLHLFGGAPNITYNLTVLKEASEPGSVNTPIEDIVAAQIPELRSVAKLRVGVHSDEHAEHGDQINRTTNQGKIGCGYWELRPQISTIISEDRVALIEQERTLFPDLFNSEQDTIVANKTADAHQALAQRAGIFTTGRSVVLKAMKQGAETMVVHGDHVAKVGIINTVPDTTFDTKSAWETGVPAYSSDLWVALKAFDSLEQRYPYDRQQFAIAQILDTLGTMKALGVKMVAVR